MTECPYCEHERESVFGEGPQIGMYCERCGVEWQKRGRMFLTDGITRDQVPEGTLLVIRDV